MEHETRVERCKRERKARRKEIVLNTIRISIPILIRAIFPEMNIF